MVWPQPGGGGGGASEPRISYSLSITSSTTSPGEVDRLDAEPQEEVMTETMYFSPVDTKMPTILEESMEGSTTCLHEEEEQEASPSSIAESGFEEGVTTPSVTGEGPDAPGFFKDGVCQQGGDHNQTDQTDNSDNVFESDANSSVSGTTGEEHTPVVHSSCYPGGALGRDGPWRTDNAFVDGPDGTLDDGTHRCDGTCHLQGPTSTAHGTYCTSTPATPGCKGHRYPYSGDSKGNGEGAGQVSLQVGSPSGCTCPSGYSPQCPSSPECNACVRAPDAVHDRDPHPSPRPPSSTSRGEPPCPGPSPAPTSPPTPTLHVCRGCPICHSGRPILKKAPKRRTPPSGSTGSTLQSNADRIQQIKSESTKSSKSKSSSKCVHVPPRNTPSPVPRSSSQQGRAAQVGATQVMTSRAGSIESVPASPELDMSSCCDVSVDVTFTTDCQDCQGQIRFIQSDELPYGWEKVEDPHYGTYYIDHVNRKTQYENPVVAAKRAANKDLSGSGGSTPQMKHKHDHTGEMNGRKSPPLYENQKRFFTRNPAELKGQFLKTVLEKSTRGFGFTIVGGDDSDEEFLQIKNVVPGGPAFVDGQLLTGDVLVFVDATCVLGYTHQDVVNMFQGIQVGEKITLEVCRGYTLPFDPNDPNTEIVTTVAVSLPPPSSTNNTPSFSSSHNTSRSDMENLNNTQRSIKSMPDLSSSAVHDNVHPASYSHRNKSFDELHNDSPHNGTTETFSPNLSSSSKPEILTIPITKGAMGFGFTIADSAYGQKVKQILDRERCLNLIEGDILVEINNTRVKDMVHADVVKVLKDCPKGQASCIVVQRGGMLTPGRHRKNRNGRQSSEEGRRTPRLDSHSNVPRTPFYSPENSDAVSEGQSTVRSRTPTDDLDPRARTPSLRPKTPTSEVTGSDGHSRSKTPTHDLRGSGRLPLADMANRRDFGSYDDRHYHDHESYGHPGYGSGEPRREYRSRTPGPDFMRGSNIQDDYMRQRPSEIRSKTPTHELHYGSGGGSGGSSSNHHNISGTPDFIPASRYLPPAVSPALNHHSGYGGYQQGSPGRPNPQDSPYTRPNYDSPSPAAAGAAGPGGSGRTSRPDLSHSQFSSSKLNSSQTYSGALNYASGPNSQQNRSFDSYGSAFSGGTGTYHPDRLPHPHAHFPDGDVGGVARPRKQSTSFEHEEPAPTNLTRIPRAADRYPTDSPSSSLNRSRSPTRFGDDDRFVELTVFLKRQESGFGFRIIGGTEEGSQVSVGHIVPGGSADLDGRLRTGDEIIYVEGMSVIGCSHHKVVQLMGQSALNGRVSLGIRRRVAPSTDSPYRSQTLHETYPYDITVTRNESEGFGFVIISSVTRAGSTIGRIIENSPAERCNQLHVGDRILAVNGIDIMRMHHEDIVQIIKDSGYSVTLTIGPPQDGDASSTASTQRSSQGSMINAMAYPAQSESDVSRRSEYSPYHTPPVRAFTDRFQPTPLAIANSGLKDVRPRNALSQPGSFDSDEEKFYAVELHRGSRGFGFSIRGGQEFNSMPLYVLRIADGGAADLDGRLRVGDQIIEINGYNTNNMTHAEAIDLIQNGGSTVRLLVKRTGKPPPQIGSPQPSAGLRPPPPPALSNGPVGQSSPSVPRRNLDPRDSYYYNNLVNHSRQHSAY